MRSASTYRGARRNEARRTHMLHTWREGGSSDAANAQANLGFRRVMANNAIKAVSIAMASSGVLASPTLATHAYLDFYRDQRRTRVVNRIVRDLVKSLPRQRAA